MKGSDRAGVLLAAAGAAGYGVTVVIGRRLARSGLGAATALGSRFAIAAAILAVALWVRRAPLRPLPGERVRVLLLGAIGYATESTLFFLALERGTAAAVAVLFYVYPALVAVIELVRGHDRLGRVGAAAMALSVAGTIAVVAAGDVSITPAGAAFALASATTYSVYLLVGRELGRRTPSMTAACWIAIGASASSLLRGAITGDLSDPSGHLGLLALYGGATAAAFWLTFSALSRIGAGRTAVVMTLEAVVAVVLGASLLHERVTIVQGMGATAVVVAAALVARSGQKDLDTSH